MTGIANIRQYVAAEFLPDVDPAEIDADFDLIESGTIDSLGLLRVVSWLSDEYELSLDDIPIAPEQFRSIRTIEIFVAGLKADTSSTMHREGV